MKADQLRQQYNGLIQQARAKADEWKGKETDMPAEASAAIDGLLGQADEVKVKIDLAERLEKGERFLNESSGPLAAPLGWREAGPGEGVVPIDEKSWREIEVKTPMGSQKIRYHVPLTVQAPGYKGAFEAYLRKGISEMSAKDIKTLTEGTDSAGGFTVDPDFQEELIRKRATMAVIRAAARKLTTSRDIVQFPRINYTTDNKYTSGARVTWGGESPASATAHRVTDPVFGLIDIPIHTAMASLPLSNNLLEDSAFDIGGYSSDLLAEAFALGEDYEFVQGSGVSRPMGLLTEVASTEAGGNGPVYVVSGTSAALTTSGDAFEGRRITQLFYTLPAQYRARASWLMNSNTMLEVETLVDLQDRPLITTLIGGSLQIGAPDVIKGRPILVDEMMPDLGANTYPIAFGDLTGYLVADRVGFSVRRLSELYAETNVTLLLGRQRVGGYCIEPWKFKVLKAGTA